MGLAENPDVVADCALVRVESGSNLTGHAEPECCVEPCVQDPLIKLSTRAPVARNEPTGVQVGQPERDHVWELEPVLSRDVFDTAKPVPLLCGE